MARMQLTLESVLDQSEYLESPGLIRAPSETAPAPTARVAPYAGILDAQSGLDAVYEIADIPQVYFKFLEDPSPDKLRQLQNCVWNRGDAPLLIVVSPSEVQILNAYARPSGAENEFDHGCLIDRLKASQNALKELRRTYGRVAFDTGTFWHGNQANELDSSERVDQQLLKDIGATAADLVDQGLSARVAQGLVGRAIFLSYLCDRDILDEDFLFRTFGYRKLADVFNDRKRTQNLIDWTQDTFNGDVFPLSKDELASVGPDHCTTVRQFLSGTDMASKPRQTRLWPYDFNTVPITLLSGIYEKFAHAGDEQKASAQSVHYTPHLLAKLVLARAMEHCDSHATVLDPACGSGIFLVGAFKELVRKRTEETGRYPIQTELVEMLTHQVCGLEISETAARVAAFSLYLALFELQDDDVCPDHIRLPHLLGKNLFAPVDALDTTAEYNRDPRFSGEGFEVVVGNPPWTPWKEQHLGERYCKDRGLPIGQRRPYHAFLWRAGELARPGGTVAMLVHAKFLFAKFDREPLRHLLSNYAVSRIINLMDFRKTSVFAGAAAPPAVVVFTNDEPREDSRIHYHCPKWTCSTRHTGHVILMDDDVRALPTRAVNENLGLLKTAFWGSPTDNALIQRLQNAFPTLGEHIHSRGWDTGRGFVKETGDPDDVPTPPHLVGMPLLTSRDATRFGVNVDCLGEVPEGKWHRNTNSRLFEAPHLMVRMATMDGRPCALFSDHSAVFNQRFWGCSLPECDARMAQYFSAVINSDLAAYYLFLTSSAWGVERDDLPKCETLALPIPGAPVVHDGVMDALCEAEFALRHLAMRGLDEDPDIAVAMNAAVFDAYDLTTEERELVCDTLMTSRDFFRKRAKSEAMRPPSKDDLTHYAHALLDSINPFIDAGCGGLVASVWHSPGAPLQVVEVHRVTTPSGEAVTCHEAVDAAGVLEQLSSSLVNRITDGLATRRSLRAYDGDRLMIVKHAELRYWTKSQARADASSIVAEHLRTAT